MKQLNATLKTPLFSTTKEEDGGKSSFFPQKSKSGFKGLKYTRSRWPSQKKAANFYIEAYV